MTARDTTAIILCGGRGTRMGGLDKPLLDYQGQPSIARIVDTLADCVAAVLISANRNLASYRRYGVVVEDELLDRGPLAGIVSCLKRCTTPYAFVCPGDAPNIDPTIVQRLAQVLRSSTATVAVAHDGRRRQNLHLLLHCEVRSDAEAYLASGARSVKGWLESMASVDADCTDIAGCFADLDEPADFD